MTRIPVTESRPVRTQFLIFTLIGEYILDRAGQIWTSSLLELMASLGVSERAVRSTLSRITRKGWLVSQMHGRHSRYTLTPKGKALLERGRQRIFEPAYNDWNENWHLIVYSLPEKKRQKRHALRKQLAWLGFGRLAPGTWLSAHNRPAEMKDLLTELEVEKYVDLFSGLYLGPSTTHEMVRRCWDLAGLESQYQEFVDRYRPQYLRCLRSDNGRDFMTPEECFVERFWLIEEFQSFPLRDPNLPSVLLPPNWVGYEARRVLEDYHHLLGTYANQYVDKVLEAGHI